MNHYQKENMQILQMSLSPMTNTIQTLKLYFLRSKRRIMISKVELRTVKVNSFWNSMHKIIWVKLVLKQSYQNWDNQNS